MTHKFLIYRKIKFIPYHLIGRDKINFCDDFIQVRHKSITRQQHDLTMTFRYYDVTTNRVVNPDRLPDDLNLLGRLGVPKP